MLHLSCLASCTSAVFWMKLINDGQDSEHGTRSFISLLVGKTHLCTTYLDVAASDAWVEIKSEWELVGSFTLRSHVDTLKGNETR